MSASGKSSNRGSEYHRGYNTKSGHGPYAAQGIRDREEHDRRRHRFTEDINDGSMCVCGVPALGHDEVYPQ